MLRSVRFSAQALVNTLGIRGRACNAHRLAYSALNGYSLFSVLYFGDHIHHILLFLTFYVITTLSFYILQGSSPGVVAADWDVPLTAMSASGSGSTEGPGDSVACARCDAPAPARSHHCRQCDVCVHKFDHHCNVIGTCIGERNHCRFWWALCLHTLLLLLGLSSVWTGGGGGAQAARIHMGLLLVPMCALLGTHSFLAVTNHTTYELTKNAIDINFVAKPNTKSNAAECANILFIGHYLRNITSFCCIQDSFCSSLCRAYTHSSGPWAPIAWTPQQSRDIDDVAVVDDICDNRYYSCC
jgi:hypothetical protein